MLGFGPIVSSLLLLAFQFKIHAVAVDFHSAYYPAGLRLLQGGNPFAATQQQISAGTAFVYPAFAALTFAPFALLSRGVSQIIYMLICVACVPAALRVLRVRDWRVYGIVFFWLPIYSGWQSANVTLPLVLLVAITYRHRDRPIVAGLATAAAISLKPFVWPLGLWLLATRRWRAGGWALALGLAINLVTWGTVGFGQISTYVLRSAQDTRALWRGGYSMLAVAHHLGFGRGVGEGLLVVVSLAVAGVLGYLGHVRRREREALVFAIVLMLVASPLVWSHYFSLLLVPIALYRPRLSPLWAVPILMWPLPPSTQVVGWQTALAWALSGLCLFTILRRGDSAIVPAATPAASG